MIKLSCESDCRDKRITVFKRVILILASCAASSLVYIDFKPMPHDAKKTLDDLMRKVKKDSGLPQVGDTIEKQKATYDKDKRGTFSLHFYFMLLTLAENLLLSMSPIIIGGDNFITRCLNQNVSPWPPVAILGLWVVSCMGNLLFYRALHPWGEVNGPEKKSCRTLFCGCLDLYRSCQKPDEGRQPDDDVEMNMMRSERDSEERCGESETSQKDIILRLEKDGPQESGEVTALLGKSGECITHNKHDTRVADNVWHVTDKEKAAKTFILEFNIVKVGNSNQILYIVIQELI